MQYAVITVAIILILKSWIKAQRIKKKAKNSPPWEPKSAYEEIPPPERNTHYGVGL